MFKNLLNTLLRFKTASALNIISLSVAYAAFMVIAMQVTYELNYGRDDPRHKQIFRVETPSLFEKGLFNSQIFVSSAKHLIEDEPRVKKSLMMELDGADFYCFVSPQDTTATSLPTGDQITRIKYSTVFNNPTDLFHFKMVEGNFDQILEKGHAVIPLSVSKSLFGEKSAIGEMIEVSYGLKKSDMDERVKLTVTGVFQDLAPTSILYNSVYAGCDPNDRFPSPGILYLHCNEADTAQVVENFRRWSVAHGPDSGRPIKPIRLTAIGDTYFTTDYSNRLRPHGDLTITRLLIAIAILIIIIASINFVNFSTAMAPVRLKGLNTRTVFGQTRVSLRRMLIFESMGLSSLGYLVSFLWLSVFNATGAAALIKTNSTQPLDNISVVLFTAGLAVVVGILAGIYPAYYSTRFEPALVLKGSGGLSHRGKMLRSTLIGFQYVISIVLIIGATFVWVQNSYMRTFPLGYSRENIVTVSSLQYESSYNERTRYADRLRENPAIEDVTYSWGRLGDGYGMASTLIIGGDTTNLMIMLVLPNFPKTLGMNIVEGRDFLPGDLPVHTEPDSKSFYMDDHKLQKKVLINRKAQQMWGLSVDSVFSNSNRLVVGVVDNIATRALYFPAEPMCFEVNNMVGNCYIRLREHADGSALSAEELDQSLEYIRSCYNELGREEPFEFAFFDEQLASMYTKENDLGILITLLTALAIIISLVGVFGLVLFETQYRRKEIGLRKVHGARVSQILGMLGRSFVTMVLLCFVIAVPIAWWGVVEWLGSFAHRTSIHWWVFFMSLGIVLSVTLITVLVQSWRAATANPIESLKSE